MVYRSIECTQCEEKFCFEYVEELTKHKEETGHNRFDYIMGGVWYKMIITKNLLLNLGDKRNGN